MPTVRPIRSGLAEPQRNELRRVARLHAHENRALAILLRVFERAADIGRIGNLLAADLENDVAGLDALVGGKKVANPADIRSALKDAQKDGKRTILMRVKSGDATKFVALRLGKA